MPLIEFITKDDLIQFRSELLDDLKQFFSNKDIQLGHRWMKSCDVRRMLRISPGTLQNLRINGTLSFTKLGKTFYYKAEDINKILENNKS